jgi:hypothetical protein
MSLAVAGNKKIIVFSSVAQIWAPAHVLSKMASRARTICRGADISIGQTILESPPSGLPERGNAPAYTHLVADAAKADSLFTSSCLAFA